MSSTNLGVCKGSHHTDLLDTTDGVRHSGCTISDTTVLMPTHGLDLVWFVYIFEDCLLMNNVIISREEYFDRG